MTTTQLYGESQAAAALALVGGNVLGTLRNDLLKQAIVAAANKTGGGGGAGDVVGPASSTDGAVALWDGATGKLLKDSSIFITGGGTVALGGFTLTVPATGTAALRNTANIFTANGAASTPVTRYSGSIFTGGSGTTTQPLFLIQPAGTTDADYSTDGTAFGINLPNGSSANYVQFGKSGYGPYGLKIEGSLYLANLYSTGGYFTLGTNGQNAAMFEGSAGMRLLSNLGIDWTDGGAFGTIDLSLVRKAANTLQIGRSGASVADQKISACTTSANAGPNLVLSGGTGAISKGRVKVEDDIDFQLGIAFTSDLSVPAATGYLTVFDKAGQQYKILAVAV